MRGQGPTYIVEPLVLGVSGVADDRSTAWQPAAVSTGRALHLCRLGRAEQAGSRLLWRGRGAVLDAAGLADGVHAVESQRLHGSGQAQQYK